jgi:hypothetical protein
MTLSTVKVAERISWDSLVKHLAGSSAAMTVKAAQDAAKAAVLSGEKIVTETLLKKAISDLKISDSTSGPCD